jgi:ETC complex I subunit-like protein
LRQRKDRPLITIKAVAHLKPGLIRASRFATSRGVTIARISEVERKTTQSGKANAGRWLLEFERQQPLRPDPLTGWNGSGDTNPQVRLTFPTREAAIAYCDKHGLQYHVLPAHPVRLKIQAYADNFR